MPNSSHGHRATVVSDLWVIEDGVKFSPTVYYFLYLSVRVIEYRHRVIKLIQVRVYIYLCTLGL